MGRVVTRSQKRLKSLNSYDDDDDDSNSNSNSNPLLPQDLMIHILTLLPIKCLVNSARYVCKSWAATIPTSQFAQACLPHSKPGLYVENCHVGTNSFFLDFKDYVNGQFLFESTHLGTPLKVGGIIDTCKGILLTLHLGRPSKVGGKGILQTQAFLVNPVIKCCLKLPPLPISQERRHLQFTHHFTIVCVPNTVKFKLFFIDILEVSGAFYFVFYVLTIGIDNSWREIGRKESSLDWYNIWKPLYDGGNYLYWISLHHQITVFDVDKEIIVGKFSLPPLPVNPCPISNFLWMGNQLSCIARNDAYKKTFQIYILDFDSGKWSLYHEMGPFDYVAACGRKLIILYLVFRYWIHDQIIFTVARLPEREENLPERRQYTIHFTYSVKTRKVTKFECIAMANCEAGSLIMGRGVTRSQKRLKSLNSYDDDDDSNSNSNSNPLLPQDLMIHILTLLPIKCLVNSARYVCKSWAATVLKFDKEITVGKISHPPVPMYCPFEDVEIFISRVNTAFLWMGNQLSCIVTKEATFKTFKIYILDFDSGKWSFYHDMGHFDYVAACGHDFSISYLFFLYWIHDQIIFKIIFTEEKSRQRTTMHFIYNVKTRKVTKIEGIPMGHEGEGFTPKV